MDSNFNKSFHKNIEFEGGLSDHPLDSGGLTKWGVTQATYDRWRRAMGMNTASVAEMDLEEARAIYYNFYWRPVGASVLPDGLDFAVFQAGVNIGTGTAVILLQRVLQVQEDGIMGPVTLAAVRLRDVADLTSAFLLEQARHYERIVASKPEKSVFLQGWLNRVDKALSFIQNNFGMASGAVFLMVAAAYLAMRKKKRG